MDRPLDLAQFEGHTQIDRFFQMAARSVNARFQPETIERHEARWMEAAYKRRGLMIDKSMKAVGSLWHSKPREFFCYFRGTRNGAKIKAETMKTAKLIFAQQHGLTSRLCAFEDKMTRLLDLIESEQIVTEQFIKECRFLIKPMGRK